jgi:hypothetical protein
MQAEDWPSGRGAVIRRSPVVRGWRSLTMVNTSVDVTEFTSPWSMRPFRHRGIGEIWMRSLNRPAFPFLMRLRGIGDSSSVSAAELDTRRRRPSHGRSLSNRGGTHPGLACEEWFRPDPPASKTTAILLIRRPDNVALTQA